MNMSSDSPENEISDLLRAIDQPARINILMAIDTGEACVCHLEAVLGMRQAYISQHLMALRQAGILQTRRDGRFIFYSLSNPDILELIELSAKIVGLDENPILEFKNKDNQVECECPHCSPSMINNNQLLMP